MLHDGPPAAVPTQGKEGSQVDPSVHHVISTPVDSEHASNFGDATESVTEDPEMGFGERESDTESLLDGQSDVISQNQLPLPEMRGTAASFRSLDGVDLAAIVAHRPCLMRSVPRFLRTPLRNALRVAMDEIVEGHRINSVLRQSRGWKMFFLHALVETPRGGLMSRELLEKFHGFIRGEWLALANEGRVRPVPRSWRCQVSSHLPDKPWKGKIWWDRATLNPLGDPERRPAQRREPIPQNLRDFRRRKIHAQRSVCEEGVAGGPTGMTFDLLRPILDSPRDTHSLFRLAEIMARAEIPEDILPATKFGRMTAFRKSNGGVRGIVGGDALRRLIARTMGQQISNVVKTTTAPFQCALSTRQVRVRGARGASHHRSGPQSDSVVHRRSQRI